MTLTAIDLFAGAGGLSEGLREAGFTISVANEINKDAVKTYEKNHPDTKMIQGDITKIAESEIISSIKGDIDLVAAGPPCQGFSLAGKRDINDPRNSLFKELVKVVKEVQPKFFLMENVTGIKTMDEGKVLPAIESAFRGLNYGVYAYTLNAMYFGVPQDRERVFILGRRDGKHPKAPEMYNTNNKIVTVEQAISDLDFLNSGESSRVYKKEPESEYQKLMRRNVGVNDLKNHEAPKHTRKILDRFSLFKEGQSIQDLPTEWQTKKKVQYRIERNKPMRTITTLPDDFIHYSKNRILTVRENARFQSFPDNYVFYGKKSTGGKKRRHEVPQYTQVGNAVPCLLAKAVGERIRAQLPEL
jgi:DNA (cytosine-5)-methyltransferase 1